MSQSFSLLSSKQIANWNNLCLTPKLCFANVNVILRWPECLKGFSLLSPSYLFPPTPLDCLQVHTHTSTLTLTFAIWPQWNVTHDPCVAHHDSAQFSPSRACNCVTADLIMTAVTIAFFTLTSFLLLPSKPSPCDPAWSRGYRVHTWTKPSRSVWSSESQAVSIKWTSWHDVWALVLLDIIWLSLYHLYDALQSL